MTPTPNPIKCKSCARTLATVSPDGLVDGPPEEGCSTCEQFTLLHDAMRAADEAYLPLMAKGDKHRGKQAALAEASRTRMLFHNYLISVEAVEPLDEGLQDGDEEEHQSGTEKTSKGQREQDLHGNTTENQPSDIQTSQHLPHRLSSKRTRSISSVPERKRIKFDDSVKFRDNYRPYLELNRSHKDYVPGRYAPPEEGYLDTSGSEISALKFTGMKRVKGGWVEVIPKEKKSKDAPKVSFEVQEFGSSEDTTSQEEGGRTSHVEMDRPKSGLLDSRTERLQRRTMRASGVNAAESGDNLTGGKRAATRKQTRMSLNRAEGEISEPFRKAAAVAPQKEESYDLNLIKHLTDVEEPFINLHRGEKHHDACERGDHINPPSNDNFSENMASYQRHAEGESPINLIHTSTEDKENEPSATAQVEVALSDCPVAASREPSSDTNQNARPCAQEILSTFSYPEVTEITDKDSTESMQVADQEEVFESSLKRSVEDIPKTRLSGEVEKLSTSENQEGAFMRVEDDFINGAFQ